MRKSKQKSPVTHIKRKDILLHRPSEPSQAANFGAPQNSRHDAHNKQIF